MVSASERFATVGHFADEPLLAGVSDPMVLDVTRTDRPVRTVRPIAGYKRISQLNRNN